MNVITYLSNLILPILIFWLLSSAFLDGLPAFDLFLKGTKDGIHIVFEILPTLIGLLFAINLLRVSGILNLLAKILSPVTSVLFLPSQVLPLILIKMFSSSAANGVLIDLYKEFGPDSHIGFMASLFMCCSETIFYTVSLYTSVAKVTKSRHTIPGAIMATLAGTIASVAITNLL
ncbi:MAG: spore maturation protein [Lachnospiraceae bacterium]|nr:spore maturation protein [Lachnospiraceae bacterium]